MTWTQQRREVQSQRMKRLWSDPAWRARHGRGIGIPPVRYYRAGVTIPAYEVSWIKAKMTAGAARGGATVAAQFRQVNTRRVVAERAQVHETTLKKWEHLGILVPDWTEVAGVRTKVYSVHQMRVARIMAWQLKDRNGLITVQQAYDAAERSLARTSFS